MPNYNTQLQSNNTDLQAILNTINGLPEAGSGVQATPEISVNSTNGLITATAGTKSSTYQLAFQPAKTITPKTTDQVAVSSGYYTGGVIKVKGDANLVAENIKSGVSIFGVNGTLESGGGSGEQVEWSANEDAMVTGTLSSYFNDRVKTIGISTFYYRTRLTAVSFPAVTTIRDYAFAYCTNLTTASFPAVTTIGVDAFEQCDSLTTVSFPAVTTIGAGAFEHCGSLTTVSFPAVTTFSMDTFNTCIRLAAVSFPAATSIGQQVFAYCTNLTTASFPVATTIGMGAFLKCYKLKSLYLTGSTLCKLSNSNAFNSTPIGGYSTSAGTYGSIYVPASLLTSYQTATNWAYFSSRFVGINPLITFTIGGTEYQAQEGMTWGEWVESEYNTNNFVAEGANVYSSDKALRVFYECNLSVGGTVIPAALTATIEEEHAYICVQL